MTRWLITAGMLSIPVLLGTTHAQTKAKPKKGVTITAKMSGFKSDKGQVLLALFNSAHAKAFPSKVKHARIGKTKIKGGRATFSYRNIPPGVWAIGVVHDENSNNNMDTNWVGAPKEGWGASRNARGTFGPKFKDAKFTVKTGDRAFKIRLKY